MKHLLASMLLLAGLTAASGCKKDTATATPSSLTVTGTLSGANQVPAVSSPGSGTVTGTYNPTTKELKYVVDFKDMTAPPTAGHFHIAPPGQANPTPTLPFPSPLPAKETGTITSQATLTQPQIDALLAGNLYANLHTAQHPGGELRANLVAK